MVLCQVKPNKKKSRPEFIIFMNDIGHDILIFMPKSESLSTYFACNKETKLRCIVF